MRVIFVVRVHKLNGSRLGFYVPKNVIEFYNLERQGLQGQIKWHELPKDLFELEKYKDGYRTEEIPDVGAML